MKRVIIFCMMALLYHIPHAQNKISGKITSDDNLPLVGATIFVPEMNKGIISNSDGSYELSNFSNGKIKIQFTSLGYTNHIETVDFRGQNIELNVVLSPIAIAMEEIVVTGGYNATQHEHAVKIEVLKINPRTTKKTSNFTEVLTKIPGVDMISKGNGVAKPVIRGLSMNDILLLNNGVRFENYQYSNHHPTGIDEFGIESVEIIKGPASLLYGSDAIGGVINFIKEKPAPIGSITGDYNLQLHSNTLGMSNNLGIKGASKKFFGGVRVGQKTNSDFLQGGGNFVPNSRFNEASIKTNIGFTDKVGTFKLYYDFNNQKLGLVEDEAVEAITKRERKNKIWYQEFNTHILSSQNRLYLGRFKLDLNSAFQNTELIHFGDVDEYELQMQLATLTYDTKLHFPSRNNSEYIIGFQGFNQKNKNINNRETILLPNATTNNYSLFGLVQQVLFTKLKLQAGLRYDSKDISTSTVGTATNPEEYRVGINKSFNSFSGSLGATYNYSDELLFRVNFAAAYRTPNLAELTSNGQHELRYEVGDQNLIAENAYETDVSLHYHKSNLTLDVAAFYNSVNNYIFIAPTGETTATGMDIYRYKQANSALTGGEIGLHLHPEVIDWLHFETTFASVIGQQKNGDYLPFIPAHKLRFEFRGEKEKVLFFRKALAAVNSTTALKQRNTAPDETTTSGYTIIDLNVGGNIQLKNQTVTLILSVNNLFDKKYIDHLSTLKEVNFYNQGRDITLSLKIPFGIKNN